MQPFRNAQAPQNDAERTEHGFFQPYSEFAKAIRTWFIAYGIGAPVLLLGNDSVLESVADAGALRTVTLLFLSGVTIQVLTAIVYKHAMWHLYFGERDVTHRQTRLYRLSRRISAEYHVGEIFVDIVSFLLFVWATALVVSAIAG